MAARDGMRAGGAAGRSTPRWTGSARRSTLPAQLSTAQHAPRAARQMAPPGEGTVASPEGPSPNRGQGPIIPPGEPAPRSTSVAVLTTAAPSSISAPHCLADPALTRRSPGGRCRIRGSQPRPGLRWRPPPSGLLVAGSLPPPRASVCGAVAPGEMLHWRPSGP